MLFDSLGKLKRNSIMSAILLAMLGRSIITFEGVLEQLCPELDLLKLLTDKMIERKKKNFDIKNLLLDVGKEVLGTGKKVAKIPGLTADALSGLARGKTKINFEMTGLDEPLEKIGDYFKYVVLVIIACVLFIGSCLLSMVDIQPKTGNGMPMLAVAGIVFSIALGIFAVKKLFNRK